MHEDLPCHLDRRFELRRRHLLDAKSIQRLKSLGAFGPRDDGEIWPKCPGRRDNTANIGKDRNRHQHRSRILDSCGFKDDWLARIAINYRDAGCACVLNAPVI